MLSKIRMPDLWQKEQVSLQIGEKRYDNYIAPHRVGFREHDYIEKVGESKKKKILTNREIHRMALYCSFIFNMNYIFDFISGIHTSNLLVFYFLTLNFYGSFRYKTF